MGKEEIRAGHDFFQYAPAANHAARIDCRNESTS
jgi:hypothetical protein